MDPEGVQMNGEELNGQTNGDHETQNGTQEEVNEVGEDVDQVEISALKEKARQSIGDDVELEEECGDGSGEAMEGAPQDDEEVKRKSVVEGDDEGLDTAVTEEGNEPELRESEGVSENTESNETPENGETEDITEHRDSDEPVENEETPGKMMAVSCDSIDVMSTTAEDGSEGVGEEVQSPVSNESGHVEVETRSGETVENAINGEEVREEEEAANEEEVTDEAASPDAASPEEEKDVTLEERLEVEEDNTQTVVEDIQSPEVASPEPEKSEMEDEVNDTEVAPQGDDVEEAVAEDADDHVEGGADVEDITPAVDAEPEIVSTEETEATPEEEPVDSKEMTQEDEQEPVVDLDAAEPTGTTEEDQTDHAAGSGQEEEQEVTPTEEIPGVEETATGVDPSDAILDELSAKEADADEEKEKESPREATEIGGEPEVVAEPEVDIEPEAHPDVEVVDVAEASTLEEPEEVVEIETEPCCEDTPVVEESTVEGSREEVDIRSPTEDIDTAEVSAIEQVQNDEEQSEKIDTECAESDTTVQPTDIPQDLESQELKESADNVVESQNDGVEGVNTAAEETIEDDDTIPESEDPALQYSPTRRPSAQERFGLPTSLSSSDSLHAVLHEEEGVGYASSDGGSSGGSPGSRRKARKTSDIEGSDMEQVNYTVRKMSVGNSKVWYKDLFNMTRAEVDKNAGEDNREEEKQSLPSLRDIKSRFENRDEAPQKEVRQPGKIKVEWGSR